MSVATAETGECEGQAAAEVELIVEGGEMRNFSSSSSVCEIEEELEMSPSSELFEINNNVAMPTIREDSEGSVFSFDFHHKGADVVYVAVGKTESSMGALLWTLNHAVTPSTLVFLIHIFPELRFIPTPLGKLPVSQVNPEQKENHLVQQRINRRELLQKFIDACTAAKVKVDNILIESDMEAKALLDLIPILNIRKLVLGTSKSSLRKLRSRRGSGIADQVLQDAPEYCEVKVICEGKEASDYVPESPSPRGKIDSPRAPPEQVEKEEEEEQHQSNDSFVCTSCFKPKVNNG